MQRFRFMRTLQKFSAVQASVRCCQTNANSSQFSDYIHSSGCAKLTPLGESSGAVGLEILPAVEVRSWLKWLWTEA